MLYDIARKIVERMGLVLKEFAEDEIEARNEFTADVVRPFVFLDMAYQLITEVDKKNITFTRKKCYNNLMSSWRDVYSVYHRGMTEDDYLCLSDFEDKVSEQLGNTRDKLMKCAVESVMQFPLSIRNDLARLYCSQSILLSCMVFINYELSFGKRTQSKMVFIRGMGNRIINLNQKEAELHDITKHLYNADKNIAILIAEIEKPYLNAEVKMPNFEENKDFQNTLAKLLDEYIKVDINDLEQ